VEGADLHEEGAQYSLADRWIGAQCNTMLARVARGFADYRLDAVVSALYEFIWNDYCDWYVELSKAVLNAEGSSEAAGRGTRLTLVRTLEKSLRALHPLAPFITEELWQRVAPAAGCAGPSIMLASFPQGAAGDEGSTGDMRWVMDFILGIRQIRGEMDIAPSRRLDVLLQHADREDRRRVAEHGLYLARLAGINPPRVLDDGEQAPIAAIALIGELQVLVPMAGLIDPAAELTRLAKRRGRADSDLRKIAGKLGNAEFLANAPPDVVAKDQARAAELATEITQLDRQRARVEALRAR